jgi:hypothetical protein
MAHEKYDCNEGCPIEATSEVIGGKLKGVIFYRLSSETTRFTKTASLNAGNNPENTHKTAALSVVSKLEISDAEW